MRQELERKWLPDAYGAYPGQKEIPYLEHPAPKKNKGKICSQSAKVFVHKYNKNKLVFRYKCVCSSGSV